MSTAKGTEIAERLTFHSLLIRSNGSALDTDTILLDGLCGLESDLVVGLVTVPNLSGLVKVA